MKITQLIAAAAAALAVQATVAAEPVSPVKRGPVDPGLVVLENGREQVTALDFDASMTRFPKDLRDEARAYPAVIMKNIDAIFVSRVAADRAREAGLDKDPLVARRLQQVEEGFLAQKYLDYLYDNAKLPDLTLRAEEIYKADPKRFTDPAQVTVQHLVVSLWGRTQEMAEKRAEEAIQRLKAGEPFEAIANDYSDDPQAKRHHGNLGQVPEDSLEAQLREAVAKMKPGETSAPIVTRSGVHVARLLDRKPARLKPYAQVKDALVAEEQDKIRKRASEDWLAAVRNDPKNTIYKDRVEALRSDLDASKIEKTHREAIEKIHTQ
jgi:peptidyl-prolyl cis-trans isomerase C